MGLNDRFATIMDDYGKNILRENSTKRFKTAMIGAIASVEDHLGRLWGHGREMDDLTESQEKFRDIWTDLRKEILDKGNQEMRRFLEDLDKYTIRARGRQ